MCFLHVAALSSWDSVRAGRPFSPDIIKIVKNIKYFYSYFYPDFLKKKNKKNLQHQGGFSQMKGDNEGSVTTVCLYRFSSV